MALFPFFAWRLYHPLSFHVVDYVIAYIQCIIYLANLHSRFCSVEKSFIRAEWNALVSNNIFAPVLNWTKLHLSIKIVSETSV